MTSMPPTRMMPLMALVTLAHERRVSAGVTFQMTCHPTMQASRKMVRCPKFGGCHERSRRKQRGNAEPHIGNRRTPRTPMMLQRRVHHGRQQVLQRELLLPRCRSGWRRHLRRLSSRRWPRDLAVVRDQRSALDLVVHVDTHLASSR